MQEERCPDPVELVGHVPLSEGEEAAHVVHAADLRHRVLSDGQSTHCTNIIFTEYQHKCTTCHSRYLIGFVVFSPAWVEIAELEN